MLFNMKLSYFFTVVLSFTFLRRVLRSIIIQNGAWILGYPLLSLPTNVHCCLHCCSLTSFEFSESSTGRIWPGWWDLKKRIKKSPATIYETTPSSNCTHHSPRVLWIIKNLNKKNIDLKKEHFLKIITASPPHSAAMY